MNLPRESGLQGESETPRSENREAACREIEPLEGEVCPQYIRCGKSGCRCQNGRPHGPYHYRIWREGIRVRKVYVKATELEEVRAACTLHRDLTRSLHEARQSKLMLSQSMQREWRRTQRLCAALSAWR